ncbi:MAG: STAS/SEC14 domain-containing protein [Myxococcales bacterium]|nr:STAS/SEC14 domain-containing protein [Myxococcales bacterium]
MAENESHVIKTGVIECSFDAALGICTAGFAPGATVTMEDARASTKALLELQARHNEGAAAPLLVNFKGLKSLPKEVRDYYAGEPSHTKTYEAVAILVDSALTRVIANFFIGFNKADKPVRLFDEREPAIEWLVQFRR